MICLAGLPFANFLDRRVDPWHGQNAWLHGWMVLLGAWSLAGSQRQTRGNPPLAWWLIWVLGCGWWTFIQTIAQNKEYSLVVLMPLVHMLIIALAYQAAQRCWTADGLTRLITAICVSCAVMMGYSFLQMANLDQFFVSIDKQSPHDLVVGTVGNPSHFSAYLAFCLPLLLLQRGWGWRMLTGVNVGLLSYLVIVNASVGGAISAWAALLWCAWHWNRRWVVGLIVVALAAVGYAGWHPALLNPQGRWQAWAAFWHIFSDPRGHPITGFGPGFVLHLSQTITSHSSPIFQWRHVHQEYFQIAIEYGIIGLGLTIWALWDWAQTIRRLPKTPLVVALGGVWVAFLTNSLVSWPAHLWVLGSFGVLAYAGIYALRNEEIAWPSKL